MDSNRQMNPETPGSTDPPPNIANLATQLSTPLTEGTGTQIGPYKLLEQLGEGGFGVVWAAEQREPIKQRVALKIIKVGMDTKQVVARFEAERQALAMMDHPNIAKVLGAGSTDSGRPYFCLELIRGIPITQYCDENKLNTKGRLELFIKVCQAIQHAQQKGIIHRDIKPSNILVTLHDGMPVPKVIDFGTAKATQQELTEKTIYTQFSQFIGTPAYMSPEQAEMSGLDIDTRSDIYSLGVLLYELLTGRTPFDARELMKSGLDEMRKIIREREPQRPSTKVVALEQKDQTTTAQQRASNFTRLINLLRGDLDWIVMKCLEKDRTRRYDMANGLALDLTRHLNHEPVAARPPSAAYRFKKAWRRNKLAVTSSLVIAATVVLASAFSTWSFVRERQARFDEATQRLEAERQRSIAMTNAQHAVEQRLIAEQNQRIAQANARQARLNLYAADMNLAQAAIQGSNFGRAAQLLNRHEPNEGEADIRHWEWRYHWRQIQGDELYSLPEFDHHVFTIDHSPDGRHLAIALFDGRIIIWDLQRNEAFKTLTPDSGETSKCLYSPDGETLFGFHHSREGVRRWNTRTFEELPPLKVADSLDDCCVLNIAVSHDSRYVAAYATWIDHETERGSQRVVLWDTTDGATLWIHPADGLNAHMGSVCFNADGSKVFVGDITGNIRRRDRASGAVDHEWMAHEGLGITCLRISPDGKLLASAAGYASGDIQLWDANTGHAVATLAGHSGWVSWLEFSSDGKHLVSASADQTARVWNMETLTTQSVLKGHRNEVYTLSLNPDSTRLVTGSKGGTVSVWSPHSRQRKAQYANRPIPIEQYYFSPDGKHLFVPTEQGEILELNPETLADIGVAAEFGVNTHLVFSPASKFVFANHPTLGTEVYDLKGRKIERTLEGVEVLDYLQEANLLTSVRAETREIVIWNPATWEAIATLPAQENIKRVISSDGRLVATEPTLGFVSVSSLSDDATTPVAEFKAHKQRLSGLRFHTMADCWRRPPQRVLESCGAPQTGSKSHRCVDILGGFMTWRSPRIHGG